MYCHQILYRLHRMFLHQKILKACYLLQRVALPADRAPTQSPLFPDAVICRFHSRLFHASHLTQTSMASYRKHCMRAQLSGDQQREI